MYTANPTLPCCPCPPSSLRSFPAQALCGIPLPRKCDTCTRCPTEVRLISRTHPDTPTAWSVTIKLRTHGPLPGTSPSPDRGRPSSSTGVHETVFASGIPTPASVEAAVAAAQAALLGGDPSARPNTSNSNSGRALTPSGIYPPMPKEPPQASFTAAAAAAASPPLLKFTRDVVVVEVWGAPVDLCLVDLPGLIANVEAPEDAHYRGLVEGLVRGYASRPGALICAVVTCKEDIDTQVRGQTAGRQACQGSRVWHVEGGGMPVSIPHRFTPAYASHAALCWSDVCLPSSPPSRTACPR
jgi:hypothetical protein